MYRKQISQKASPSLRSTPKSQDIAPSPSYGSLSAVVQRAQQDPNSVSEDERQQLENAIGTRSTQDILGGKQSRWVPEFQGISAQLWGNTGQVDAPIQAKGNDDVEMSEVQPKNRTGLPDNLKAGVENLSGMAMDDVRVHYNSSKPAEVQALAYTQGTDIHVAPGQEQHLPHEAWHVVQQMQGRVKPTMQMKEVQINDNEGLEREADVMGAKALSYEPQTNSLKQDALLIQAMSAQVSQKMKRYTTDLSSDGDVIQLYKIIKGKGVQGGYFVYGSQNIHVHYGIGNKTHLKIDSDWYKLYKGNNINKYDEGLLNEAVLGLLSHKMSIARDIQRANKEAQPIQDCLDWLLEQGATMPEDEPIMPEVGDNTPESKQEDTGYGNFFANMGSKNSPINEEDFM